MSEEAEFDELFLFLEPGSDPAADRAVLEHSADSRTLLVWVPDADRAAEVAAEAVDANGVRLVELYRGFDLRATARVVESVVPRAPVANASFEYGVPAGKGIRRSATIYHSDHPAERVMREHGDGWTIVVSAPIEKMPEVAEQLVAEGADLVEICGGTELTAAAAVRERLGDRVPVSLVSWPFESLDGAYAFKSAYAAAQPQ